jgi:hypothetical protein
MSKIEWIGGPLRHAIRRNGDLSPRSLCGLRTADILDAPWRDKPMQVCKVCRATVQGPVR